jgi:hypothetical protein
MWYCLMTTRFPQRRRPSYLCCTYGCTWGDGRGESQSKINTRLTTCFNTVNWSSGYLSWTSTSNHGILGSTSRLLIENSEDHHIYICLERQRTDSVLDEPRPARCSRKVKCTLSSHFSKSILSMLEPARPEI